MCDEHVWTRLEAVFREVFGEDVGLQRGTTADDVYGWDSVRNIELMVAVERAFSLRFTTSELSGFANVGELADLIEQRTRRDESGAGRA